MDGLFRDRGEVLDASLPDLTDDRPLTFDDGPEPYVEARPEVEPPEAPETSRALALTDVIAPRTGAGEALIRLAYRMGVPGHALAAPFRKPALPRLLGYVESPIAGDRAAGTALRAGHFMVQGVKLPIARADFSGQTRLAPGVERCIHGFGWLADLSSSAPREQCTEIAQRVTRAWLDANGAVPKRTAKSGAWELEHTGLRLMAWLVHAPLIITRDEPELRFELLDAIGETATWLDRKALKSGAGLAQMIGWAAVTAAGLLLPEGKPRRIYGQAALIKSLGDLVAEDGGVLARCPAAQMQAIATLTDLIACYEAVRSRSARGFVCHARTAGPAAARLAAWRWLARQLAGARRDCG